MLSRAAIGSILLLTVGCYGNEETVFPPGLEPLEPNLAMDPMGTASDPYPEQIVFFDAQAMDRRSGTNAVHARAYIHAPVSAVWQAMQNPDANADRRAITSWTSMPLDDPMYDASYVLHIVVVNVITIEYELTWRHGVIERNADQQPIHVAISWQKTWGSTALAILEGSAELKEVAPGITELSMIEYLNAVTTSHATIESYFHDMYGGVLALSHGMPLPPVTDL